MDSQEAAVISARQKAIRLKQITSGDIVQIGGFDFRFEDRRIQINDAVRFSILLPTDLIEMSEPLAELKYPSSYRPTLIMTQDQIVDFTFQIVESSSDSENEMSVAEQFYQILNTTNPAYIYSKINTARCKSGAVAYFHYKSYAVDEDVFNFNYFTKAADQIICGTINCAYEISDNWKDVAREIIKTIAHEDFQDK